jgi:hypothetical protein
MTEYETFALTFLAGLGLTLLLGLIKARCPRLPWLVVLAPFVLNWFISTASYVFAIFYWHYNPPFPWSQVSLIAFLYLLAIVLLRRPREARLAHIDDRRSYALTDSPSTNLSTSQHRASPARTSTSQLHVLSRRP